MIVERWQHHYFILTQRLTGLFVKSIYFSNLFCIICQWWQFKNGGKKLLFFAPSLLAKIKLCCHLSKLTPPPPNWSKFQVKTVILTLYKIVDYSVNMHQLHLFEIEQFCWFDTEWPKLCHVTSIAQLNLYLRSWWITLSLWLCKWVSTLYLSHSLKTLVAQKGHLYKLPTLK